VSKLKQIQVESTGVRVANALRNAILTKEFHENDIISLKMIAEKLGVSNTPVREALQLLAQDGLVELRPNKGAIVLGVTEESIRDYYETRILLECGAARKACQAKELTPILKAFAAAEQLVAERRYDEYATANQALHQAVWEATGNRRLIALAFSLWNSSSRADQSTEQDYVLMAHEEHRNLTNAIRQRDPDEASRCMEAHLQRSMRDVMSNFRASETQSDQSA
jgi:DNA-binding GntR family transcriptional regulator